MNFLESRTAMLTVFRTVWAPRHAIYPDVPGGPPTTAVIYARVSIKTAIGRQGSLTGGNGTTIWDRLGTLWIEVRAPVGDGLVAAYSAAQELVNAYQAAQGSVWYRNIRMVEVGEDGAFQRVDVKADFEYTDVR